MLSEVRTDPPAPCPAPFNLAAHVLAREADLADKIALKIVGLSGAERWSYGKLARAVRGVAGGMAGLGLAEGSLVLLRIGNSVDFPLAFLGCVAAGLLPVACPAALTETEVTALAAGIDPALIVAAPGVSLPRVVAARTLSTETLRTMTEGPEAAPLMGDPERPAYLVYTSGTSGKARAVIHAHRAVWARQMMWQGWYGLSETDRLLHAGAMNWTFTLGTGLLDPWAAGATALVPEAGLKPADLPLLLKHYDATLFAAAPGVYRQLLKSREHLSLPRLRHGLTAGEILPAETRAAWERATGTALFEAFGMSECSTFLSASPSNPAPAGAIGHAQPGRRIAILGKDSAPCPRGTPGVLAVHRTDPGLFLGYHGAPAEAAARFRGDWFLTGDLARMDAGGAVTCLGREDDMMNAGGFRVSPAEVEATLAQAPDAGEVAVTEVLLGPGKSIIAAFYTGSTQPDALRLYAEANLARYKCPRTFNRVERLPLTPTGKVNRRALREERIENP